MLEIQAQGVPCSQGSCSEVYLEKAFDETGWRPKDILKVANDLGNRTLAFLVHPTLERHHIEQTCAVLRDVMLRACR